MECIEGPLLQVGPVGVPLSICTWQLLLHCPFLCWKALWGLGQASAQIWPSLRFCFLEGRPTRIPAKAIQPKPKLSCQPRLYPTQTKNFPSQGFHARAAPSLLLLTHWSEPTWLTSRQAGAVVHSINRASSFDRDNPFRLLYLIKDTIGNCPQGCGPYDTGLADPWLRSHSEHSSEHHHPA